MFPTPHQVLFNKHLPFLLFKSFSQVWVEHSAPIIPPHITYLKYWLNKNPLLLSNKIVEEKLVWVFPTQHKGTSKVSNSIFSINVAFGGQERLGYW